MQQVPSSTRASIKIWPASPSAPGPLVGPPALLGASAVVFQWPRRASPQAPHKGKETCADRTAGEDAENRCVQEEPAELKPPRAGVGDRMLARVRRPGRAAEKLWPGPGVVHLKPARHAFCPCPTADLSSQEAFPPHLRSLGQVVLLCLRGWTFLSLWATVRIASLQHL